MKRCSLFAVAITGGLLAAFSACGSSSSPNLTVDAGGDDAGGGVDTGNPTNGGDSGSGSDTGGGTTDSGADSASQGDAAGDSAKVDSFPPGTICNDTGTARTRPATVKHVIVIIFENKDYDQVMGNTDAPYINSIRDKCGYSTQYRDNVFATDQESLPHYMALTSGSNCNTGLDGTGTGCIQDDDDPSAHTLSTVSIMEQAPSYRAYIESMPSACDGTTNGEYATKHNPPPYYEHLAATCAAGDVGIDAVTCPDTPNTTCGTPSNAFTQDLANDTLPAFVWLTPNLTNDSHDGTVTQADNWLHTYLPLIVASPAYLRGEIAVHVLWDEQDSFTGGPQPNLFVSPYIQPTKSTETMNHFAALRAAESQLGIGTFLGCASGTQPGGGACPQGSTADLRAIFNF